MPPSSASSCSQQQVFSFRSNSIGVAVQDNIWQINMLPTFGSPAIVTSIQMNAQGQSITGTVLLLFVNANHETSGPYAIQMNSDGSLIFQNVPSTPMSLMQIQFPDGTQTYNYVVNIASCIQTNVPPTTGISLFCFCSSINYFPIIHSESIGNQQPSQQWIAPVPAPVQNNYPNNNQIASNQYQYPGVASMLFIKYSFVDQRTQVLIEC